MADDSPDPSADSSSSTAVRDHLLRALEADLVGPFEPEAPNETLPHRPTRWYLTGFLTPETAREVVHDPTNEDELDAGNDADGPETASLDPGPKVKHRWPASLGVSVLLPSGPTTDSVTVTVSFADYEPTRVVVDEQKKEMWRRRPKGPYNYDIRLDPESISSGFELPEEPGLVLVGKLGATTGQGLSGTARALSIFLVNRRPTGNPKKADDKCVFQVQLELSSSLGFLPRKNLTGAASEDWDDNVADLQFREKCEYAVGHGVAVDVVERGPIDSEVRATRVRTTWIPRAEVRRVEPRKTQLNTEMRHLAALDGAEAVRAALLPLVDDYGRWIEEQRRRELDGDRRDVAEALMDQAQTARERIRQGIVLLADDAEVRQAFAWMNEVMAVAAQRGNPERYADGSQPAWRLFQLAFVLLNLPSISDPQDDYRSNVELIFFPTGGGKTEAYLGVIALTLLLRRMRGQGRPDAGLGVAVLLRYTLRLLTLDQLARASTLMCALEQLRQQNVEALGRERFAIGLWVGRSATANTMKNVSVEIGKYKTGSSSLSPFPLTNCPWCGSELGADSFDRQPNATRCERVVVGCSNWRCDFCPSKNPEGLPVLFVDEQIYHELPCFMVATVDKFAMMPWRGEIGALFGRVHARHGHRFYGPLDGGSPKGAIALRTGLHPPELIIQDELHLISGPLGTMVGLYETAIDQLCTWRTPDGGIVTPKVLAATATVRRAAAQVQALFGRTQMALFPPPGVDDSDTFFAELDLDSPGRLYVGVAAPGRGMKGVLLRVYTSLLAAANRQYDPELDALQPADGYMTIAGYFNSLRELGGMRRLVEDDVRTRARQAEHRAPYDHAGPHPWYRNRSIQLEPVELTSRESTEKIKRSKARLDTPYAADRHVDVLLASNMISVGVDIDRLGVMVVAGQPKTTSEYIQASSRVGRDKRYPGLVVTCLNPSRPRDRSHFERFAAYHESFYRHVEAMSLTPFSGPALDRGLAGVLVAMTRLGQPKLTHPTSAMLLTEYREVGNAAIEALVTRAEAQPSLDDTDAEGDAGDTVRQRGRKLLDLWEKVIDEARENAAQRVYSQFDRVGPSSGAFLHLALESNPVDPDEPEAHFVAPTSMRDVEPTVHLWIPKPKGGA